MGVSIERSGDGGIWARFREMEAIAEKAAGIVAEECREECPVDSGKLKESIRVEELPEGPAVAIGGDEIDYAPYVLYGTSRQAPNNFVARALVKASRRIREAIRGG
jgi:hypothetical protein